MKPDQLLNTTETFIREFYESGTIKHILSLSKDTVVGYSSRQPQYAVNKKTISSLLQSEYLSVNPCRMIDAHFNEEYSSDKSCTIKGDLILSSQNSCSLKYYHILIIYDISSFLPAIDGIHISELPGSLYAYPSPSQTADYISVLPDNCMKYAHIVYRIGSQNHIQYCDQEFYAMSGCKISGELTSMDALICENDLEHIRKDQFRQLKKNDSYQLKYRLKNKNSGLLSVIETGSIMLRNKDMLILNSTIINMTPFEKISGHFSSCLFYDNLTGIYNKETFYQKTRTTISKNSNLPFEIMCVDIERFKVINEIFGKDAGNSLLLQISNFLKRVKMQFLIYGRLYADKFILCYPVQNNNRQYLIASLRAIASAFKDNYNVILCFGVYSITDRNLSISIMCDKANLALKRVKGHYLVSCGEYDEVMHQNLIDEQILLNDMNRALNNNEFTFYLQPKYDLNTRKITGSEALVRWIHPAKGFIGPDKFIPVFEQNGFILRLDRYIWEEVCKLLRKWQDLGKPLYPISVNISRTDLYSDKLVEYLGQLVKKYDIPPRLLELELTESAYFNNPEQIIGITQQLQRLGFIILMDDFGSGYSSLNMLKDINVNILKVDLKFLQGTSQTSRSARILNSVVRMARCLNLPLIIEGVETQQQAEFLRSIGCCWVQGYYYSRPVPVKTYEKLITETGCQPYPAGPGSPQSLRSEDFFNPNTKFNLLFNSITCSIGIYEFTKTGLILLRANDSYFHMFNYNRKNLHTRKDNVLEYVHENDRTDLLHAIHIACCENKITQCCIRCYTADNRLLRLLVHISRIEKENDYYLLYMAIEASPPQNISCAETRALLENLPAAFGIFELCGGDIWARKMSSRLYAVSGCTPESFMASTGGNIKNFLDDESTDTLRKMILHSYRKKQPVAFRYSFTTRSGRNIPMTVTLNTVKSETEHLLCYVYMQDSSVLLC